MRMVAKHHLVMIEWVDAVQPIPAWKFLEDLGTPRSTRCASVGWLVHDDEHVKVLAPNLAGLNEDDASQISGTIRIPACSVVKISRLDEPPITFRHPQTARLGKGWKRRAS